MASHRSDTTPAAKSFWAVIDAAAARAEAFPPERLREVGDDCPDMPTDIALPRDECKRQLDRRERP